MLNQEDLKKVRLVDIDSDFQFFKSFLVILFLELLSFRCNLDSFMYLSFTRVSQHP